MSGNGLRLALAVGVLTAAVVVGVASRVTLVRAEGTAKAAVAVKAKAILQKHCTTCHGEKKPKKDLNVLDRASLLDAARTRIAVVLNKPDESNLIKRVESTTRPMPPEEENDPLSKDEIAVLRQWITDGADLSGEIATASKPADLNAAVATKAREVLKEYCAGCHGYDLTRKAGLNVLDRESLLDPKRSKQRRAAVVPGKPDDSEILIQIADGAMPLGEKSRKVPEAGVKALKEWIAAGAPAFPAPAAAALPPPVVVQALKPTADTTPAVALKHRVETIFRAKCLECHGGSKPVAGLRILKHQELKEKGHVVPGNPDASPLVQRVLAEDPLDRMPPGGQGRPPLTPEEKKVVSQWVAEKAEEWDPTLDASGAGTDYVLRQIVADVARLSDNPRFRVADLKYVRYVSFNHLLAAGITERELTVHTNALAFALNSASWLEEIEKPTPIDATSGRPATVFRINIQNLGWHEPAFAMQTADGRTLTLWDLVTLEYPYATLHPGTAVYTRAVRDYLTHSEQVRPVLYVRGDWLLTAVSRSPLYEDLLQLPFELSKLEDRLGVNSEANVAASLARRGGVTVSGVSRNNRVVERHTPRGFAYYWKSFDFKSSKGAENMFRDPINLNQSGGEMIWSLPNRLQAYYVCDARGNRIDAAPTEIVTDAFASDKVVRNGLACMRCHDKGMQPFQDDVLPALSALGGGSRSFSMEHMEKLYAPHQEMNDLLKKDGGKFKEALQKLFGAGSKVNGAEMIEPAERYLEEKVNGLTAAAELGRSDVEAVRAQFRSRDAVDLGVPQLATNGAIRRDAWEDYFDQVVRGLAIGDAVPNLDALGRSDYQPLGAPFEIEVTLNKPAAAKGQQKVLRIVFENKSGRGFLAKGDKYEIKAINETGGTVVVEGFVHSLKGEKVRLKPSGNQVKVEAGETAILAGGVADATQGKEELVFYASDRDFPAGVVLRPAKNSRDRCADRVFHSLYRVDGEVRTVANPARMVKRTFEIETR